MVLHIVDVPNPDPGVDWVHTVPGKYLYNVTGVIGRLTTSSALPTLADASGNGLTMTAVPVAGQDFGLMLGQPGAIPNDTAVRNYEPSPTHHTGFGRPSPTAPMTYVGDWSVECWMRSSTPGTGVVLAQATTPGGLQQAVSIQADGTMRIIRTFPDQYTTFPGAGLFDGNWHHYVWSFPFAGAVTFWRDGVQRTTNITTAPGSRTAGFGTAHNFQMPGVYTTAVEQDELAVYPSALTGAQVAAHYAARGNFATYSAAVLADAPAQYYHLDDANLAGGRQVTFLVTDGAVATLHTPTGFPTEATGHGATYSWQPLLQASSEDVTGHSFAVPLPALVLPAGYTLGSYTLDLAPTDQWSGVKIWWDDALQTAQQQAASYQYAPGAHLIYQQTKAG